MSGLPAAGSEAGCCLRLRLMLVPHLTLAIMSATSGPLHPAADEACEGGESSSEEEEASGDEAPAAPAAWGSDSDSDGEGEGGGWGSDGGPPLEATRRLEDLSEDDFSGASDGEDEDRRLQLGALLRCAQPGGVQRCAGFGVDGRRRDMRFSISRCGMVAAVPQR